MCEALVHRGPDDGSVDVFGRCVLGHRRLIVVDPETGYQPVANEAGDVVCVLNGELYNFRELRRSLAGHEIRGRGDTAVIPHLYEEHGLGFVERLHGMFALALWDARRERLVLARDRVGKKPLLWTRLPSGAIAFASELKALTLVPGVSRELNLRALDAYLALQYVPHDETALEQIGKVPPGHSLVFEGGGIAVERYWTLEPVEAPADEDVPARVREVVEAAVARRLVADVPLGALLSGGIDSSVVVAAMAKASTEPVRTFTVGFEDARYDERAYARAIAERYGTRHEEIVLEADVAEALPRLTRTLDEPLGDEAALPLYLVCEEARRHVTVALTGDGGDEAFAGYERYAAVGLAGRVPAQLASAGAAALRLAPRPERRSLVARATRFLDMAATPPVERYGRLMEVFPPALRLVLWTDEALAGAAPAPAHELLGDPPARGVRGLQMVDVATYLPGDLLLKADLASMAHSLELRSPFLDHEVLELGISLPDRLKVRGREGKLALRDAFADDLPEQIATRGKAGFGVPLARWFREDLRDLARDALLGERARGRGCFRPEAIEGLLAEHQSGRADHGHRLWCLLVLELWQREHVDAGSRASAPTAA
jgi:asparagine synthase (glutamine-hydrolysing)